jgi:hypothetical protein
MITSLAAIILETDPASPSGFARQELVKSPEMKSSDADTQVKTQAANHKTRKTPNEVNKFTLKIR